MDWIKQWIHDDLEGDIRFALTPAERGVYYDLRLLAGRCSREGTLAAANGTPYSETYIAGVLNIDLPLLRDCLKKCAALGLLDCTEAVRDLKWARTQSEYSRRKTPLVKSSDPDKYVRGKYGHMVQR
jgi:hypothetical protein